MAPTCAPGASRVWHAMRGELARHAVLTSLAMKRLQPKRDWSLYKVMGPVVFIRYTIRIFEFEPGEYTVGGSRPGNKGRELPGSRERPAADGQAGTFRLGKNTVLPESLRPFETPFQYGKNVLVLFGIGTDRPARRRPAELPGQHSRVGRRCGRGRRAVT